MSRSKELAARRQQLIDQRTRDKNRLQKAASATIGRQIRSSVNYLSNQIERLEKVARDVLKANPDLKRRYDLALSVPGAGPVLALSVTAFLPELGTLNCRELAALVGVAPYNRESGSFSGRRSIYGAGPGCAPSCTWPRCRRCAPISTSWRYTSAWSMPESPRR